VKIGDLVKRNEKMGDYLSKEEMKEVGMIIAFDNTSVGKKYSDTFEQIPPNIYAIVLWSRGGLEHEDIDDMLIVACNDENHVV